METKPEFTLPSDAEPIKPLDPDAEAANAAGSASEPSEGAPKRRGPKPGSKNKKRRTSKNISENNLATARLINGIFFGTFGVIGGEDALPDTSEQKELDGALHEYLNGRPEIKIPPEYILAAAYGKFVFIKITKPTVWERVKIGAGFAKNKIKTGAASLFKRFRRKEK